jgi:predicted ABC-type transport system involved in lysophospholipase L1 biosynthesis ATPase subunit
MIAVRLTVVSRSFGAVHALRGVTLDIAAGERLAILGKSGSGKSTLLHLLAGLDRSTSGSIVAFGDDLAQLSSSGLAEYRLRKVGIVFQAFHLIPTRTALENVCLPLILAGVAPDERLAAARAALADVGLREREEHLPTQLSGGEQQRVAIARALINGPQMLLCDEPTGNLDSANAEAVMALLMERAEERGVILVLVTHDEELARRSASRIIRLHDGEVVS